MDVRDPASYTDEQELLRLYLRDVAKHPLLSREQEKELGQRIRKGDEDAIKKLVESNLRFVVSYAKKYRGLGLSYLDLIHEGNLGLLEAARRFDPTRDVRFLTYAGWWVRRSILTALRQRADRAMPRFARSIEGNATVDTDRAEPAYGEQEDPWLVPAIRTHSLSQPVGDHEDLELADRLENDKIPTPEEMLVRTDLIEHLQRLIAQLPDRDAEILEMRYGFGGEPPKTLQEIGDALGLTRQRVQQIERAALAKLRQSDRARALRAFLN